MWLRMSPVTLPFRVQHPVVDRYFTYLRGLTALQAQSFGKSGCIDRPRNRIDADSAVLVFRAPNHS